MRIKTSSSTTRTVSWEMFTLFSGPSAVARYSRYP
jgi:hypothetical protein